MTFSNYKFSYIRNPNSIKMHFLKQYVINFTGLKDGLHNYEFSVADKLLRHYNFDDFNNCRIDVKMNLVKKPNLLELSFFSKGVINLNCFVSNEPFDYSQNSQMDFVVKFGNELNNDNHELLILPKGSYQIDISQQLYEMIVLSLPLKITHPGIVDGTLKSETLERLKKFGLKNNNISKTDPRWDKLKDLI